MRQLSTILSFFFNDTATTEIYTLSLHDALPIWGRFGRSASRRRRGRFSTCAARRRSLRGTSSATSYRTLRIDPRSEEHTSELQSRLHLVCRLLLEKKKNTRSSQRCWTETP